MEDLQTFDQRSEDEDAGRTASTVWDREPTPDAWVESPVEAARALFEARTPLPIFESAIEGVSETNASLSRKWRSFLVANFNALEIASWSRAFDSTESLILEDTYSKWKSFYAQLSVLEGTTWPRALNLAKPFALEENQPTEQLQFALEGGFAPSKKLTDFWVRGVTALATQAGASASGLALASTDTEIQQEFTKMLTSLFGTTGQQLRYEPGRDADITRGKRFLLPYQIQLVDRFFIIPDETAEFLQLLRSEMVFAISNGARIEGGWGAVQVNRASDLYYDLEPPNTISDPSFVPSQEVE
jgi:hypothetical protein